MPYKHNADRRHHIGKMKFRVTNWRECEAGLRQRGSITFWLSEEVLSLWHASKRKTPGGQPRYSDLAVETSLKLGLIFNLPLRQIEGFVSSLFILMGICLPIPDHTTLSRRCGSLQNCEANRSKKDLESGRPLHVIIDSTGLKIHGAGQWLEDKHGRKSRRQWRKLHIAINAGSGDIIAEILTDQSASDISQLEPLLDLIDDPIDSVTADGAYDGQPSYDMIQHYSPNADIVIPLRSNSIGDDIHGPPNERVSQRNWHIATIRQHGRLAWQAATGYGKRSP